MLDNIIPRDEQNNEKKLTVLKICFINKKLKMSEKR